MSSKGRIHWIDVIKAFAIYAIVLGHTLRGGDLQAILYSYHVPLFFLISGFCFSVRNNESFFSFLKRKAFSLLVPYFSFGFLSIGLFLILGSSAAQSLNVPLVGNGPFDYVFGLLYGNASTGMLKFNQPLWFLPCLFVMELFSFLVVSVMARCPSFWGKISVIMVFTGAFNFLELLSFLLNFPALPFGINTAINTMVFFLCGIVFRLICSNYSKVSSWINKSHSWYSRICFGLFGVVSIAIGILLALWNDPVDYVHNAYGNLALFFPSAFCGCFGWIAIALCIEHSRGLEFVGRSTLIVLCLHKFPVLLFQTKIGFTASRLASFDAITGLIVALVSLLLCLPFGLLLERYLPAILGKHRKASKR